MKPDDYVDAFKTFVTYEDKMWGLPIDGETTGLFYRTDMFEAAGIDSPPTTWEEFEQAAAALTDEATRQFGYELFATEAAYYWYPWLYQAGGDLLSEDGKILLHQRRGQGGGGVLRRPGQVLAAGLPQLQLLRRPGRLR